MATSCEELTHWKRPWCWEGLGAGGEGDNRGWDGWMASPTQWTWVWVNSGSWWWTGRPGVLWIMGLQRVRHDWATELNWTNGVRLPWESIEERRSAQALEENWRPCEKQYCWRGPRVGPSKPWNAHFSVHGIQIPGINSRQNCSLPSSVESTLLLTSVEKIAAVSSWSSVQIFSPYIYFFLYLFIYWPCGMWDLSSLTRDWTYAPCMES